MDSPISEDAMIIGNHDVAPVAPNTTPSFGPSVTSSIENEKLQIIAEPNRSYRARYASESPNNRFIQAEENGRKLEYPTIKIPSKWCHPGRQLFIRVTLVTVLSEQVPFRCIHPYEITTSENDIIKDAANNSIYFHINPSEFMTREKSFRIIVKKMKQEELKEYGPMRAFGCDQHLYRNIQHLQDVRQIIRLYQLSQSQFIFTIAELQDNNPYPVLILQTSVESQIMIDTTARGQTPVISDSNGTLANEIKCVPQKGDWHGGDEVVMIMPNLARQKVYKIFFDFGRYGQQVITDIDYIDTKTILFRTPACPVLQGDQNLPVFINVQENNILIQQIEFIYLTSSRTTNNICSSCRTQIVVDHISNEEFPVVSESLSSPQLFNSSFCASPPGMHPSDNSNPGSVLQLSTVTNDTFIFGHETIMNTNTFGLDIPNTNPLSDLPVISSIENEKLQIIAEPQQHYRSSFLCNVDESNGRTKCFIRAENNYREDPTIKFRPWYQANRELYIRVTLVTVPSDQVPSRYIHPYEIDTSENNTIRDPVNNSIYFPINENESIAGERSFRIIIETLKQDQLKAYGPFRLFGSDQLDVERVGNPQDTKEKIAVYQLWKSQLVFTIAERQENNSFPVPILHTSVESQIMVDEAVDGRTRITTDSMNSFEQSITTTFNTSNENMFEYDGFHKKDERDGLVEQLRQLSIEQVTTELPSGISPTASMHENETKYDKYFNQLKDALIILIRRNDPSRLFRRTRVLLSKFDENLSPLSDAIERGHIQLALPLIEQVIDMPAPNRLLEKGNANGETPLLIAAKLNHGKIIETILKKRSDLVEQKDKDGNNMFHLLANLREDKGADTIQHVFGMLSNDIKSHLMIEKNKINQTPLIIAQSHGNTLCVKFLSVIN